MSSDRDPTDDRPPRGRRGKGKGSWSDPAARASTAAAVVWGLLIGRLDRSYLDGELGRFLNGVLAELLGRDPDEPRVREISLGLLQHIQLALFPEDFADRPRPGGGLLPAGTQRAGVDRYERLIDALRAS